jgi:hypothetical protein
MLGLSLFTALEGEVGDALLRTALIYRHQGHRSTLHVLAIL